MPGTPQSIPAFLPRTGCPFCGNAGGRELAAVDYLDTAEAHSDLPNVRGKARACPDCGVAYPSHVYDPRAFTDFYAKSFIDLDYFDRSPLQAARMAAMRRIMRDRHRRFSLSSALDSVLLHTLQVPFLGREPKGLKVLDVGCGFGEFSRIFRELGNEVACTEIFPALAERMRGLGFECQLGELEEQDFGARRFDVVLLRAVFYRTREPARTLRKVLGLLAPGGEIALVDPCPGEEGVAYYLCKQFPQGQFYILDQERYLAMLRERFGLACTRRLLIYGRPQAPLRKVRLVGNFVGFGELLLNNLLRRKPYVLAYNLVRAADLG